METKYRLYAAPAREVAADTAGAVQQRAPRRPVYTMAALLFAEELPSPLSCTVRDLSGTGARLELDRFSLKRSSTEVSIPKFVIVYFCPEKTEVECRLAWQDGRHFGVRFMTEIRPSSRQLP